MFDINLLLTRYVSALEVYLSKNKYSFDVYGEQLMKQICQSKYEQETTEQEYYLLQEQINYFNLPNQSFEHSPLAQSTLLDSVANPNIRQQLFQQYRENAVQSRANVFHLYLKSTEDQRGKI